MIEARGDTLVVVDQDWRAYWEKRYPNPLDDAETLQLDDHGRILSLGKKPKAYDEIQAQYIGLIRFTGEGIARLRAEYHRCDDDATARTNAWGGGRPLEQAYMTDLINHLCQISEVKAVPVRRGWVEIDNEVDLAVAQGELAHLTSPAQS